MKNIKQLIKKIRKIDSKAAKWLTTEIACISKLRSEGIEIEEFSSIKKDPKLLISLMVWSMTPQGFDYWACIDAKLGKM